MTLKTKRILMPAVVVLSVLLGAATCNEESKGDDAKVNAPKGGDVDKNTKTGATKADAAKKDAAKKDAAKDPDALNAPAPDIYPGINFGALDGKERTRFVKLAESELCPCPKADMSLHVCLQKKETQCDIALRGSDVLARSLKEGVSDTEALNRVAEYFVALKKTHTFNLTHTPFKGNKDAKVVIVEFADFECPHCRMVSKPVAEIAKKYGDNIAVYFKHYPLRFHPQAKLAAYAAAAAHKQGKFWEMHDQLFEHQKNLGSETIESLAKKLGLNFARFQKDMGSADVVDQVAGDLKDGTTAKIDGTPTLFINNKRYLGDLSLEALSKEVDAKLTGSVVKKETAKKDAALKKDAKSNKP